MTLVDAGALLRDGKAQMSQVPSPFLEAWWGQSSPCQVLGRQGEALGGGSRGLEKEGGGCQGPSCVFFLFLVMQVPHLGFDCEVSTSKKAISNKHVCCQPQD